MTEKQTKQFTTTKVLVETLPYLTQVYDNLKPLKRYDIVHHCIKFFAETGYDPRHFADALPAMELQKLKAEIKQTNEALRDQFVRFMRTHEKEYLRPLVNRVDGAVSVLGEYLKGKVVTNEFDASLLTTDSTPVQKDNKPDWAKGFIAQEVKQQTIKVESTNNERQLLEMTIKIEKLEKKNIYLSEKIDFVKSRIEVTKKHGETQYLLKLDEAEYLDLVQ